MANKKPSQLVRDTALGAIFGISKVKIKALCIEPVMINGDACYPLDEVVTRCQRTVAKTMAGRVDTDQIMGAETIKKHKMLEAARKLQMSNDALEAGLIDLVQEACPDISPEAMAIVEREVAIDQRNLESSHF